MYFTLIVMVAINSPTDTSKLMTSTIGPLLPSSSPYPASSGRAMGKETANKVRITKACLIEH